jgi:Trk K+ transport system NAD-binding subunit
MWRAGADRVGQPCTAAGQEMAKLVPHAQVAAFLDIVTSAGGPDLQMQDEVASACTNASKTIRELRVSHQAGALIVALRKRTGPTPSPMRCSSRAT